MTVFERFVATVDATKSTISVSNSDGSDVESDGMWSMCVKAVNNYCPGTFTWTMDRHTLPPLSFFHGKECGVLKTIHVKPQEHRQDFMTKFRNQFISKKDMDDSKQQESEA